jgi:hypothetical protein
VQDVNTPQGNDDDDYAAARSQAPSVIDWTGKSVEMRARNLMKNVIEQLWELEILISFLIPKFISEAILPFFFFYFVSCLNIAVLLHRLAKN